MSVSRGHLYSIPFYERGKYVPHFADGEAENYFPKETLK